MRLKSFYAKTMTEAMQMVRDTLGEDAVIVATREEKGGNVHITAAVEPAFETGRGGSVARADDWLQYDDEQEESAVAEELTEVMLRHSVPEEVMDHILSCAMVLGMSKPSIALTASLEHLYSFRSLPRKATKKAQMMVGPPGSGKTLATAKLATRSIMDGLTVGIITTDTVRAGGIEQLQSFTRLLRVPLEKITSEKELSAKINELRDCDHIIIDTSGTNPFDTEQIKALARMVGCAPIEPYLVMPAGNDAEEAGEMARIFAKIGVDSIIPTRLDISRRLGGLLSAAHYGRMNFADGSKTPKVANGLIDLTPEKMSQLLMPAAYRNKRISSGRKTGTS